MAAFIIWCIGWEITANIIDPKNKRSFWQGVKLFFEWPEELGHFINKKVRK